MNPFGGPWGWMYWNLMLAVVPAVLACIVFRSRARLTVVWWLGVGALVLWLPNAPYVLTDVMHLRWDLARAGRGEVALRYAVLFGVGMLSYAVVLWRGARFLVRRGVRIPVVSAVVFVACALCSLGIYLGRVHRFNSWDVVRAPHAVVQATFDGLSSRLALAGMGLTFAVIAVGALTGIVVLEAIAAVVRRPTP